MRSEAWRALLVWLAAELAGLGGPLLASPPSPVSEYQVKAVFILHLTRYLQWPRPEGTGNFEIAVLGESPIVPPLRAIAAREKVQARSITIREVADLESLGQPQVLFVARPAGSRLAQVLKRTQGRPILTIAEEEGLAAQGLAVNFVLRGESVKFEINEGALRAGGLEPGAQLLRLAILVRGPG